MDRPDMIARLGRILANEQRVADHVGPVGSRVRTEARENIEALEWAVGRLEGRGPCGRCKATADLRCICGL